MRTAATILSLAFMMQAMNASAQTTDRTTYWNFDQFSTNNETVGEYNNPLNYGGLYIAGHSTDKPTVLKTLSSSSSKRDFSFGDYKYNVNTYIQIPGNNDAPAIDAKASDTKQDAIALDVAASGTLYVRAEGSAAGRGIAIFFNASEVATATSAAKGEAFTASATNSEGGTYYIKSTAGACNIYAVKFTPDNDNCEPLHLTMTAQGVRTFSDTHAWKVPSGMEAYIAGKETAGGDNVRLTLTKIDSIPACTGVIVRGEANATYDLEPTDCGSLYNEDRTKALIDVNYALRPVVAPYSLHEKTPLATTSSDYNVYLLALSGGSLVFGPTADGTLQAGKAYYRTRGDQDLFAKQGATSGAKGIGLDFAELAGVETICSRSISPKCDHSRSDCGQRNLIGLPVGEHYRGMVIMNGKKIIRK